MEKRKIIRKLKKQGFQAIEIHSSIGSTNDRAMEIVKEKRVDLGIVIAEHQTRGRGRGERRWEMEEGAGLALSIIFGDISEHQNILGRVTGIGALAVTQTVAELFGLSARIKWPNDVLLDGKKFCGILTEADWVGNNLKSLVVGIGINITKAAIPKEVIFPATALEVESEGLISREDLLDKLIMNILRLMKKINSDLIIKEWEDKLAFKGSEVILHRDGSQIFSGKLLGLDDDGGIVIQTSDEQKNIFYYGDIHLAVK